jgi:hypothetical protein
MIPRTSECGVETGTLCETTGSKCKVGTSSHGLKSCASGPASPHAAEWAGPCTVAFALNRSCSSKVGGDARMETVSEPSAATATQVQTQRVLGRSPEPIQPRKAMQQRFFSTYPVSRLPVDYVLAMSWKGFGYDLTVTLALVAIPYWRENNLCL